MCRLNTQTRARGALPAMLFSMVLPRTAQAQQPATGPSTTVSTANVAMEHSPTVSLDSTIEARFRALETEIRTLRAERAANIQPPTVTPVTPATSTSTGTASSTDFAPAVTPFGFGDFSWAPGSYSPSKSVLQAGPVTGEIRLDVPYHFSFADPIDNTISGSSEVFRHNEFQVTQIGFGGDFYFKGVHARLMTQFGMYSQTTARNDPSAMRGQWQLDNAYRYISEAYVGYHFNVLAGINIQAGIFMSYVGLWAYYNFDNWTYQPSYVSSNTPWFFNGVRVQIFVNDRLKIEPWLVNGWQAYGQFNRTPGVGLQVRWSPTEWLSVVGNQYYGADTLGVPDRMRVHTDDSVMIRFYNNPRGALSKWAGSFTFDAGCEFGNGANGSTPVTCGEQFFLGFMAYTRVWFYRDMLGFTIGGGAITNPGRYLVLVPPINGATAYSGTPYFPAPKGSQFNAWDLQTTFDVMPTRNITFRLEFNHRAADVPYFAGHNGVTPPGGNNGMPAATVTLPNGSTWNPDLVPTEDRLTLAMMARL